MEVWAKALGSDARFICVCVDSKGVALQFSQMFGFEHAINCWIPGRNYFPVGYGQLGCSGFIVSDAKGCFVSRKTRAFLEYGEAAFSHVEELLAKELPRRAGPTAPSPTTKTTKQQQDRHPKHQEEPVVLSSVGVRSIDHEHEQISQALSLLRQSHSVEALRRVVEELISHFDHEEELMKRYGFGGATTSGNNGTGGSTFSAFASHAKDHQRILRIGQDEINRLSSPSQRLDSCSGGGAESSS